MSLRRFYHILHGFDPPCWGVKITKTAIAAECGAWLFWFSRSIIRYVYKLWLRPSCSTTFMCYASVAMGVFPPLFAPEPGTSICPTWDFTHVYLRLFIVDCILCCILSIFGRVPSAFLLFWNRSVSELFPSPRTHWGTFTFHRGILGLCVLRAFTRFQGVLPSTNQFFIKSLFLTSVLFSQFLGS